MSFGFVPLKLSDVGGPGRGQTEGRPPGRRGGGLPRRGHSQPGWARLPPRPPAVCGCCAGRDHLLHAGDVQVCAQAGEGRPPAERECGGGGRGGRGGWGRQEVVIRQPEHSRTEQRQSSESAQLLGQWRVECSDLMNHNLFLRSDARKISFILQDQDNESIGSSKNSLAGAVSVTQYCRGLGNYLQCCRKSNELILTTCRGKLRVVTEGQDLPRASPVSSNEIQVATLLGI